MLDFATASLAVLTFVYFSWALRGHFASDSMPAGVIIISALALLGLVLGLHGILITEGGRSWLTVVGFIGMTGSLALFHAAILASRGQGFRLAFDEGRSQAVVQSGPYRWVRHPFYTSYVIYWISFLAAAQSLPLALPALGLVGIYVLAARREEVAFEASSLATDYRAYRQRTGFFFPKLRA